MAAAWTRIVRIYPKSMPTVTGPVPSFARALPNPISRSRVKYLSATPPRSRFGFFSDSRLLRRGDLPTSLTSSICRSISAPKLDLSLIRAAFGVLPAVTAVSVSRAQVSASDLRRNARDTCRPRRRTCARHFPEGSLLKDAMVRSRHEHRVYKTSTRTQRKAA